MYTGAQTQLLDYSEHTDQKRSSSNVGHKVGTQEPGKYSFIF